MTCRSTALTSERGLGCLLLCLGAAGVAAAVLTEPSHAASAAAQDWSPFVLVSGLLLVGLVANDDGLFEVAGQRIARAARSGVALFFCAAAVITLVTAVLNLDTAVAFLTPVLIHTARNRRSGEQPLVYACLLLANAGSLLLPGSNLTNLIVLGHLNLSGAQFLQRMWLPWLAASVLTAVIIAVAERRSLGPASALPGRQERLVLGVGLAAVLTVTVLVLALPSPAIPVAAVGVIATAIRIRQGRRHAGEVVRSLGLPILAGLFGIAVALGTLGRTWSGPEQLLGHLDTWATAAVAAVTSVLVNNLPAASLLAAGRPPHPFALLVGLNIGPNLFVTGSLAWILWLRSARVAGARPSVARASLLGAVSVPIAMAAALAALAVTAAH